MVIFFDLDDTLLDYTSAMRAAAGMFWADHLDAFADFGIDSFTTLWESLAAKYGQRAISGEVSFHDQQRLRLAELFERVGRAISPRQAEEMFGRYFEDFRRNWRLFPDVWPCLNALSPVPLGVISNGESSQQRRKLADLRIEDRFGTVVISSQVGVHKPDPAIFRHAAESAGAPPGECVFVGDQLDSDARAASAAGFTGIWLNRSRLFAPGCDVESIESLNELPAVLGLRP
jgi:putative hydrolase of the HAD superfamily